MLSASSPHCTVSDRIFVRDTLPRERFADDRDGSAVVAIGVGEVAAAHQRDAHRGEIATTRQAEIRLRQLYSGAYCDGPLIVSLWSLST
jgi:hypothetical protein